MCNVCPLLLFFVKSDCRPALHYENRGGEKYTSSLKRSGPGGSIILKYWQGMIGLGERDDSWQYKCFQSTVQMLASCPKLLGEVAWSRSEPHSFPRTESVRHKGFSRDGDSGGESGWWWTLNWNWNGKLKNNTENIDDLSGWLFIVNIKSKEK